MPANSVLFHVKHRRCSRSGTARGSRKESAWARALVAAVPVATSRRSVGSGQVQWAERMVAARWNCVAGS